jgi:AraC-like DNA-binding protein
MRQFAPFQTHRVTGFEELNEAIFGVRRDVVQIERGKIQGRLSHASIGDLPVDVVKFNLGVRTRGTTGKDRTTIGMLLEATNRVTRASFESRPGDVVVTPPGAEHENRYYGGASIFVISVSPTDIEATFGAEGRLGDPATWRRNQFKGNAYTVERTIPHLQSLVVRLGEPDLSLTAEATDFWKRAIIEAVTDRIADGEPSERDGPLPSALKVVRQVEEYLDTEGTGLIHISRICGQLHVSRRTLHRAFHEALGIGPIAFLRYRRLCSAHTAIRSDFQAGGTIADMAIQHGFLNVGRFAQYYRQLFGEYPSDTRLHKDDPSATGRTGPILPDLSAT